MNGSYDPLLVAFSVLIAIFASFTALDLANSVAIARGRARAAWLSAGALAMGVGIWSMHFTGMLAFSVEGMSMSYDVPLLLTSVGVAILASALALAVMTRGAATPLSLVPAALAMGAAIAGMHYIGMWSMRMPAVIRWVPGLVAASIAVAVAASFAALWLAYRYRLDRSARATQVRIGGSVVMGFGIVGMHYTAMAAARLVPRPGGLAPGDRDVLASDALAIAVLGTTLLILAVAVGAAAVGRELTRRTREAVENARLYREAEALTEELQNQAAQLEEQASELEALNDELGTAESRLRGIVGSVLDAMIVTDSASRIVEWNQNAERIFGWSAEEALETTLTATIIPRRFREAHEAGMRRFLATGEGPILNRRIEIVALRRDGQEFPVELAIAPIRSGGSTLFTAFIRDISEQKRAEEQERELVRVEAARAEAETAERRIAEILESITDAFLAFDREWRVVYANSSAEDLIGASRESLLGTDFWDRYPALRSLPVHETFRRVMSERVVQDVDLPSRLSPGMWLRFHIVPTSTGVAAYIRDITSIRDSERALRKSQAELSAIVQGMRDVVLVMDGEGRYKDIAPTAAPLLYRPPAELLGRTLHEIFPTELADFFLGHVRQALATGETRSLEYSLPFKDRVVWFDGAISRMTEDRVVLVAREVTDRKQLEEVLRAAKDEAERANREKSTFLSRMSHELRTPLNAILGFGQLLEQEVKEEDDRESVHQILRAGRHLRTLIDEVLDISRIEAGKISISLEPVGVSEIVGESVDLLRIMAADRRITIDAEGALAPDRFVRADRQRLKQVVLNLLSNAIKYNRPGGTVTLSCEAVDGDRLRITVQDMGRGIPPEKLARLFTPFERLDAERIGVEGIGLGLALSRGLLEVMGGTLGVESRDGEGSRFWLELPREDHAAAHGPPPDHAESDHDAARSDSSHTVLFVEDNPANLRLMQRVFQSRPAIRLVTAMQGGLGLKLARECRPDLILLDLNLPDLSGDEFLVHLSSDPDLAGIPVLMVSGDANPSQIARVLELGAVGYITKPFDIPHLLRQVDRMLRRAEGQM